MTRMADRDLTPFEAAIVAAQAGELPLSDVLDAFERSRVHIPSRTEAPGGDLRLLQPLVFDREGAAMLAVFSHPDRIGDFATDAPYVLELLGSDLVRVVPPGSGVVVNPRHVVGLEIVPSLLDILRTRQSRLPGP